MRSKTGGSKAKVRRGNVGETRATLEVEHVDYPGWTFTVTVERSLVVGFAVEGAGEPIGKRVLQALPMRDIEGAVRGFIAGDGIYMSADIAERLTNVGSKKATTPAKSARASWSLRDLAELADEYLSLLRLEPERPVEMLAVKRGLSVSRVRNLLGEARNEDLLTRGPRGRAGGQLTAKAERILNGER